MTRECAKIFGSLSLAGLLLTLLGGCATNRLSSSSQELDYCARALSKSAQAPFSETLRVKVLVHGERLSLTEERTALSQLIREKVWQQRASDVFLEPFSEANCTASGNSEAAVSVELTPQDVSEIRTAVARGPGTIARITEVATRASTRLALNAQKDSANKVWLRVYFATNRRPVQDSTATEAFNDERSDQLSYGSVDVSVERQKQLEGLESPSIVKFERSTDLSKFAVAGRPIAMSHDAWKRELAQRAASFERPGVLLFIHGYNVSFSDAARRAAQLTHDLAFTGPTVFLAWPSDASVVKYLRDGRDAENSWTAAASVLGDLASLTSNAPLYVIGHSMGNRVMLGGLVQVLEATPQARRVIREVVMAAPDVDQDSFRLNIAPKLLNTGPRFTLYASEHDLALGSSEFLHGGKRLGIGGDALYVSRGVDSIDASLVTKEFFALNHSYFGDKTAVLSDIFYLIRQSLPPDRRPNLKKGTGATETAWLLR